MENKEQTVGEKLQEKLFSQKKNGILKLTDAEIKQVDDFCEGYKVFLDKGKTERETVTAAIELAKAKGFTEYDPKHKYSAGDKVYYSTAERALFCAPSARSLLKMA